MKKAVANEFIGRVYIIKNTINDKVYIGETLYSLTRRLKQHFWGAFNKKHESYNCHFFRAIRKYGKECFYIELLEEVKLSDKKSVKKRIQELEVEYIKKFDSFNNGYNSDTGGNGGKIYSEDSKRRMSLAKKNNPETLIHLRKVCIPKICPVDVYDYYNGEYIESFSNLKELAKFYNIDHSHCVKVCKNKSKYATINNRRVKLRYSGEPYIRTFQFTVKTEDGLYVDNCVDSYDIKSKYGVDYSAVCRVCNGEKQSAGKLNGKKLIWSYYEKSSN